jgi:hypothetical protein
MISVYIGKFNTVYVVFRASCFKCFYSSSFASVPDFKHLLYIMTSVQFVLKCLFW